MPLIQLLEQSPEVILSYNIRQIVSFAGNGVLNDNSECAKELSYFLKNAPTEKLYEHVDYCLSNSFEKGGYVLQDIINELGRRLDYEVENGLYQGRSTEIGFDGIWRAPNGHAIIIETKTTDAYRIRLNNVANYREKLIEAGRIDKNASSILIVVGRDDTGDLEEQIRGSRYAWDARIISTESLIKLVELKIKSDEDETTEKIRSLLIPFEYTRLDNIIDVMFTTAKDVESADTSEQDIPITESLSSETITQNHTPREIIEDVRVKSIAALAKKKSTSFIAHKRAQYWNSDKSIRVVCPVSKRYDSGGYWYAFHPHQKKFLADASEGFFMLGCVDDSNTYAIPLKKLEALLPKLHTTERPDGKTYWHIHVNPNNDGVYELNVPNDKDFDLTPYQLEI